MTQPNKPESARLNLRPAHSDHERAERIDELTGIVHLGQITKEQVGRVLKAIGTVDHGAATESAQALLRLEGAMRGQFRVDTLGLEIAA